MKKIVSTLCVLCGLFFVSSCTTLQTVSFDRLQAADINFPEQIRKVGIVNAMPALEKEEEERQQSSGWLEGDGKVAAEVLAQEVASSRYFDQVVIGDSALSRKDVAGGGLLSDVEVDSLVQAWGVDMLLVMERIQIQLSDGVMLSSDLMAPVPAVDGVVTPLLRGYVPGRRVPLFTFSKSDTLCWEKSPSLTLGQIARESSEYAATLPIRNLLPHWMETERYYFDGGSVEMRDAGVCVRENNWEDAARLWRQAYDTKKGKAKMRAAFNLALSCEMQDDFDQALEYLEEATSWVGEESPEAVLIQFYRQQLEEQLKNNQRLQIQMKRFER